MASNGFGTLFRFTTWGESHGPAIGCVVDGTPPRLPLGETDIQAALDRRKPGGSRFVSQRREPDRVRILSGVFEGRTTGAPIALVIENEDARGRDYAALEGVWRPGHADFTYDAKYGIRDHRGGGRASARETAMRVAAGAVAGKILGEAVAVRGALVQVGAEAIDRGRWDWAETARNPFFCPDAGAVPAWEALLDETRRAGSSVGAVVEVVAEGVPAGLGAPVYGKIDADLAAAMMSINAVKGVEIGAGFAAAGLSGEENADEMRVARPRAQARDVAPPRARARDEESAPRFLGNRAGGVLGGITTGQPLVVRFAVKPTSSIRVPRRTVTRAGAETDVSTTGRHDPCVGIRAVPVGEAMMACVLADHLLRHRAQCG